MTRTRPAKRPETPAELPDVAVAMLERLDDATMNHESLSDRVERLERLVVILIQERNPKP